MAESPLKKLLVQASHYGVASLLNMAAGLVTFPLLTRLFSVADYGVMNLIAATLTVAVALGKVGVQHSIVRYHSEIVAGKSRYDLRTLISTTVLGMAATGLFTALLLVAGTQLAPSRWLGDPRLRRLFALAAILVVVQVMESAFVNFLRAEQKTSALMKYQVAKKYLGLGLIVGALLLISRTLTAFYSASVLGEGIAVAVLGFVLFTGGERPRPTLSGFSRPLYRELLGFGVPMMIGYEFSGIILAVGDRYVIDGLIGEAPLGLYSAAYNLCTYVQMVFVASVGQAIMPIYMRMFDEKGVEETSSFIAGSLRTYALFGAPVIAGLAAVGPELLPTLASEKYASAAGVLPWVIAGMVVDGTNAMVGAGLFIHRKTRRIMAIVLSSAVLNLVLNLILVPRIGILGAAIATLVSYAVASLAMAIAGRHLLPIRLPWATTARAAIAAGVMYAALIFVFPGHRLLTVAVRGMLGAPIYGVIMVLIDPDAKALWKKVAGRLRRRGTAA
jgi:O-antigen/teichoic acid export membrane protein